MSDPFQIDMTKLKALVTDLQAQIDAINVVVAAKLKELETNPNAAPIPVIVISTSGGAPVPQLIPIVQHAIPPMPPIHK